jgi:DeoR/GlpR family transcriptional regulator of sugar metabolism
MNKTSGEQRFGVRERHESISELLGTREYVSTRELADRFSLSDMSVRRDLEMLAEAGVLRRVRGGAVPTDSTRAGISSRAEPREGSADRRRIGVTAARLLEDGAIAFVDGGWTALDVVSAVSADLRSSITIVTHSLPVLEVASRWPRPQLITLAGFFVPEQRMFAGPQTLRAIESLRADIAFVGCDGLSAHDGLTTPHQLAGEVIAAMVERARRVVVVAESFKVGRRGFTPVAPTERIDVLVTDDRVDEMQARELTRCGVEVVRA